MSKTRLWTRVTLPPLSPPLVLFGVALLGLLARIWVVTLSLGSNDMVIWRGYVTEIDLHGLGFVYDYDRYLNHPPLMALWGHLLYIVAAKTGARFEVLFKTPQLLADAAIAALIYRTWQRRSAHYAAAAAALFCWNPASFLVTAYHGNTDAMCVALALAAVLLVDSERPLLAGLALGASINVKLLPILLIPVLYSCVRSWRKAARFTFGLSFGVLPFVPLALWHWQGFYAHVLCYRSRLEGWWGITAILGALSSNQNLGDLARRLNDFWVHNGSYFVLLAPLVLGGVNLATGRSWSARELGACAFSAFLVLTPGLGVQYIVYPVTLLFATNLTRAVTFSTIAGLYAFVLYYSLWTHSRPFFSDFHFGPTIGTQAVGYLAWMVIIRTVVDLLRAEHQPPLLTTTGLPRSASPAGEGAERATS